MYFICFMQECALTEYASTGYIYDDGDNADDQHDITSAPKRSRLEDSSKGPGCCSASLATAKNFSEREDNCDEDHN